MLDIVVLVPGRQFAEAVLVAGRQWFGLAGGTRSWLRAFRRAGRFAAVHRWSRRREPGVLVELGVVEQRYRAVLEVLEEGASVTEVARRHGVVRQTVHEWLARYAADGLAGLAD